MKPPARRRSAPTRFEVEEPMHARTLRLAWTPREKMELLKGLKAQKSKKVPTPSVKGRSQSEVSSYIAWLRGRAARESVQTEYEKWVRERNKRKTPAHIELWTDLVCRMSSQSEEALSAAFSQMLTIASTEPVTVRYSAPSKPPRVPAPKSNAPTTKILKQKGSVEEGPDSSGVVPSAVKEGPASSGEVPPAVKEEQPEDQWKKLDFEKIYKYLSKTVKGETLPRLSACESAVVLHLLSCLPEQLHTLNAQPLSACLRKTYTYMNLRPEPEDSSQEGAPSHPQEPDWREMRFCPLNPFLLPVELLQPKEEPSEPS